jgi:hypothetical protein
MKRLKCISNQPENVKRVITTLCYYLGMVLRNDKKRFEVPIVELVQALTPFMEPHKSEPMTFYTRNELSFSMGGLSHINYDAGASCYPMLIKHLINLDNTNELMMDRSFFNQSKKKPSNEFLEWLNCYQAILLYLSKYETFLATLPSD